MTLLHFHLCEKKGLNNYGIASFRNFTIIGVLNLSVKVYIMQPVKKDRTPKTFDEITRTNKKKSIYHRNNSYCVLSSSTEVKICVSVLYLYLDQVPIDIGPWDTLFSVLFSTLVVMINNNNNNNVFYSAFYQKIPQNGLQRIKTIAAMY